MTAPKPTWECPYGRTRLEPFNAEGNLDDVECGDTFLCGACQIDQFKTLRNDIAQRHEQLLFMLRTK